MSLPPKAEMPSDSGVPALRPSGVAPTYSPMGTLAATVAVDGTNRPPMGPRPYRVLWKDILFFAQKPTKSEPISLDTSSSLPNLGARVSSS